MRECELRHTIHRSKYLLACIARFPYNTRPMSDEIRNRILAAAARVYSQYGFRGATTRLIATEAGVNEVTLFRTFGSKADLLQAMLATQVTANSAPTIAGDLTDPAAEITAWCGQVLEHLRGHSHIIR